MVLVQFECNSSFDCRKVFSLALVDGSLRYSYRYMVGMGLESTLTLSGSPIGVCGVHLLMVDSLRDICDPSLPPSTSTPLPCISCLLILLLRYHRFLTLYCILSVTKRSHGSRPAREYSALGRYTRALTHSVTWTKQRSMHLLLLRTSQLTGYRDIGSYMRIII